LYTLLGRFQDALRSHEAALAIREKLAKPDNDELQAEMAQALCFVGTVLSRLREHSRALGMCESAVQEAESLHDHSNATFQELTANLYAATGEIAAEGGAAYTGMAIKWMLKASAAYRKLDGEKRLTSDGKAQWDKIEQELAQLTDKKKR